MARFGPSTVDSLLVLAAATLPNHPVRLVEFLDALDGKSDIGHTHAQLHDALTITPGTGSILLTLNAQSLSADVVLAANSGLQIADDGLSAKFGTGSSDIARGNHTHTQLHDAATVSNSDSIAMTIVGQAISSDVIADESRGLSVNGNGVGVIFGATGSTVSAGNHSHSDATSVDSGFMSAADKVKLDAFSGDGLIAGIENTDSIYLSVDAGTLTATFRNGTALNIDPVTHRVNVDIALFATAVHSHANATSIAAGFMSAADKARLDSIISGDASINVIDTDTIDLTMNDGALSAVVNLKLNGGLGQDNEGAFVEFGTGINNAARGNHTHAQLHDSVTTSNTNSVVLTLVGQALSADVNVARGLSVGVDGVGCVFGTTAATVSEGNHTHSAATSSASGLMSAADKAKLDGLTGNSLITGVGQTSTVGLAITGGILTAQVSIGSGLEDLGTSVGVDFTLVATASHTHSSATTSVAGFLSAADKTKLDAVATNGTADYDVRYLKLSGGQTMTGLFSLVSDPVGALNPATKQYVDSLISVAESEISERLNIGGSQFVAYNTLEIKAEESAAPFIEGVDTWIFHFDNSTGGTDGRAGSGGGDGGTDGELNPMLISRIGMTETLFRKTLTAPTINDPIIVGGSITGLDFSSSTINDATITGTISGSATYTEITLDSPVISVHAESNSGIALQTFNSVGGGNGTLEPVITIVGGITFNFGTYDISESAWSTNSETVLRRGDITATAPIIYTDTIISCSSASANTANYLVKRDGSGNFSAGTITAALSGNASTATILANARDINGVSFNGSANITVTADAGTLTGTTLNASVVSSSLTTVGTLTSLTLSGLVSFTGTGHAGLKLNNLTTTQRDALTGVAGDLIYNSTTSRLNYYSSAWKAILESGDIPALVLASALTGLSTASSSVITSADTVLSAFGKLQAQVSAGSSPVYSGNYAGVAPGIAPTQSEAIAFDTSTGTQWNWFSGAWH